jgi:molecular chaperone DnaK
VEISHNLSSVVVMRLFISFAHIDEVLVGALARILADAGHEVWWDDQLQVGDDWEAELMRQIAGCDVFLYVASDDSAESEWCRWELAQARALFKTIVPVMVRSGVKLPRQIASLQYADLSSGVSHDRAVRLIQGLARLRQTMEPDAGPVSPNPRGFPARFTRPLPRSYRTVAQGYLRPAAPDSVAYEWPNTPASPGDPGGRIVGIDFGTTTSAVALHRGTTISLLPNDLGETDTPSAVAIGVDGMPVVGRRAIDLLLRRPERGVLEVKRLFGREIIDEVGGPPVLEVDGISYSPVDLAAFVFRKLRIDAESHLGSSIRRAVLTAPAYFDVGQRVALRRAAQLAGFEVVRMIAEPVAACLGVYRSTSTQDVLTLVYDLGGGTFDVSLVECGAGVFVVKTVNGDTHVGGADFDREVVDYCVDEFRIATGIGIRGNATALMRLRHDVERAKIDLSTVRLTTIHVPFIVIPPEGPVDLAVELTRVRYNELTHNLVARSVALTRSAVDDAGASPATLDDVIVVGRAAAAPSVRVALRDLFGDKARAAPDHVVALGAAVQAGVLDGTVKDMLLLDTVTHTLRVQVAGGRSVPVIPRNRTIPDRSTVSLTAQHPDQRSVLIRVLAGESSWSERNLPVVEVALPCPLTSHEQATLTLTLDIDANSVLSIGLADEREVTTMSAAIGLRGGVSSEAEVDGWFHMSADKEARLPAFRRARDLRPMPDARLTDLIAVKRWVADAAMTIILTEGRRRPSLANQADDLQRCRDLQGWLQVHPEQDIPADVAKWQIFELYDTERERLVDLLEQRTGIDLMPVRHARSIASMSERLVERLQEWRT